MHAASIPTFATFLDASLAGPRLPATGYPHSTANTTSGLPEHVLKNRAKWDAWAEEYAASGERGWAQDAQMSAKMADLAVDYFNPALRRSARRRSTEARSISGFIFSNPS